MQKDPNGIKIFVSNTIPDLGIELLRKEGFDVSAWVEDVLITRDKLIAETKKCNALLSSGGAKIDEAFLNECSHLDIISNFGVGYDNIDIAAATRLGIPVGNTPGVLNDATADIAFGLMIAVSRKMFYMYKKIERGEWTHFSPKANLGIELKNKTLGVFGLGRIGIEMAKRCKGAYNMNIIYCNRKPNKEAEKLLDAKYVSFDELLAQSDVLSVHSAFTEEVRDIFNKDTFSKMKPTSIFINTSRGGVHNEEDLIEALNTKKIWGAGLDVTNPEPMQKDNPLLQMENVAVLPHIGSATVEARDGMSRLAAENIIGLYKNGKVPNLVNPDVMKKL
ncbi:D-glycerate dehydrogenase [Panacibacter ginsenosidivorans]|uniref:Glyoxylate/hydroxypyruvate reductase B n=1 Tax=Panacibacter ginsenosidivorans TaxID=1813871 RepID=A0A5B8V6X7_9BACT|nr:D-glycerate dehydrogenase [Panacibacter ginsenosidivorans]QEC66979.1 D-glycerate dehydrogenase [Panacibacter ginsenosidivorans]